MRQLPKTSSLRTYWEDLIYLEAALLADPQTQDFAAPITAILDEGTALMDHDLKVTRLRLQAKAKGAVADGGLDDGLSATHNDVLHHAGQDRKHVAYKTLFQDRLSKLVRYALNRQLDIVEGIVKKLSLNVLPEELTKRHTQALSGLIAKGRAALDAIENTELDAARLRLKIDAWKQDANAARNAVHGELSTLAANTKRPRTWADRFFKPADIDSPEADDETPPPTPPK
jgi:hypothetical protein